MKEQITKQTQLIAYCGLYCSNCIKYKKGKCPGCAKNEKASWCKIRSCCIENGFANCSECEDFVYPKDCKKYNNFISVAIEFFSSSDRSLCIDYLRKNSSEKFVLMMNEKNAVSLSKKEKHKSKD